MAKKERIRLQPIVDKSVVDRLDKLAATLGWSRNEVAEHLLELGTSGAEWVGNYLAAQVADKVMKAFGSKAPAKKVGGANV